MSNTPLTKDEKIQKLLELIDWLSDKDASGGAMCCHLHKGYGFSSDCSVCELLKAIETPSIRDKGEVA